MPDFYAVYYSRNRDDQRLLQYCLEDVSGKVVSAGGSLITVTQCPVSRGEVGLLFDGPHRGHRDLYARILLGLSVVPSSGIVCTVEDDVLYPGDYFHAIVAAAQKSPDALVYNTHVCYLSADGFGACGSRRTALSNLAARTDTLSQGVREKLKECGERPSGFPKWSEPGMDDKGHRGDNVKLFHCPSPVLDIRNGHNFTGARPLPPDRYFHNLQPWGEWQQFAWMFS